MRYPTRPTHHPNHIPIPTGNLGYQTPHKKWVWLSQPEMEPNLTMDQFRVREKNFFLDRFLTFFLILRRLARPLRARNFEVTGDPPAEY